MHLRRTLLLFAIVLAVAALVGSLSRPTDTAEPTGTPDAPAAGAPGPPQAGELTFDAESPERQRHPAGVPATVVMEVDEPGQAEIPELGLVAVADPLTPARFEVLRSDPGSLSLRFTPTEGGEGRDAGTLVIVEP